MKRHLALLIPLLWGVTASGVGPVDPPTDPTAPSQVDHRRVWVRSWNQLELKKGIPFVVPLRFRFDPTRWREPETAILPASGTDEDITAAGYKVNLELEVGGAQHVEILLGGETLVWDRASQVLNRNAPAPAPNGKLKLTLVAEGISIGVYHPAGQRVLSIEAPSLADHPELTVTAKGGAAKLLNLETFGLRGAEPTPEESRLAALASADNRVFYRSPSYTVYGGRVEDAVYGRPAASVPEANTIVSPTRVIEGFVVELDRWRPEGLQGRVIDHQTIWHPHEGIRRFPSIQTGWPTVDAACRVALDVLQRCGDGEFARNDAEIGLWEAGFFFGPRQGFGIWTRDSTHVALRAGNLIDPEVARRTLMKISRGGVDNGCDGVAMPAVGLWDYYLATGDESAIREVWDKLKANVVRLDELFDPAVGLVKASHSTSNDAFEEPEAGGFALGTETYFMLAYRAMAAMGRVLHEAPALIQGWEARERLLCENIRELYWKESAGFFTTGPKGSEGYAQDFWESSGQELAIWPRFNIASPAQRRRVLDRLPQVALNEFGVDVFPYRRETNHFCHAGWVAWTAGMAAAAGREGRLDLLQQLIGQQVRNAVIHKTFYEVIDHPSGRAWRWPGQLWQAAGFLSYFTFGVLGMEYDEAGLTLHPAVPETLANLKISNLRYREATLDLRVKGWGTTGVVLLDGIETARIPSTLQGPHRVDVVMNRHPGGRGWARMGTDNRRKVTTLHSVLGFPPILGPRVSRRVHSGKFRMTVDRRKNPQPRNQR